MRPILIVLLIAVISAIFAIAFIAAPSFIDPTGFVVAESKENKSELPIFRTYTKAVCENVSDIIACRDILVVNCAGIEHMLKDEVNGIGNFSKQWNDPRSG